MNIKSSITVLVVMLVVTLSVSGKGVADGRDSRQAAQGQIREKTVPSALNPGLNHLLDLVNPGRDVSLDIGVLTPVLDFVVSSKKSDDIFVMDGSFDAPSAYIEVDLKYSLQDLLQVSYNPKIPSYILTPSSMRLAYWKTISQGEAQFENLWELVPALKDPLTIRGIETVENTPDIHTGAYYKYDLDRTMILFDHQGRKVFISLSRQTGHSEVGKKGVVLGDDKDWNYLYSGEKGINKFGLGWVDSYMYDSSSVIVYYETDPGKPQLRCAVFKWLRAGWKNINMVQNHHIYNGMKRWAQDYKAIMEHPEFPGAGTLANVWSQIEKIDETELKLANRFYYQSLEKRYADDESVSSKWVAGVLGDDARVEQSDLHELRSVLVLEYLKRVLGKPYELDVMSRYNLDTGRIKLSSN